MDALHPTEAQAKAFLESNAPGEPVFMLNLLRFRARAEYESGEDVSGAEAYGRYAKAFGRMLRDQGVDGIETVFGGKMLGTLIGDAEAADWDAVALVRYPDAQTMWDVVSSDAYRAIHHHRKAGLAGQLLLACNGEGVF